SPADDLPSGRVDERGERHQPTVAEQALPFVGVVDARHLDAFVADVVPDIEFCPVAQRKDPNVLPPLHASVQDVPYLRPLSPRFPTAEAVADREDPFLCARLLLVPSCSAYAGIE